MADRNVCFVLCLWMAHPGGLASYEAVLHAHLPRSWQVQSPGARMPACMAAHLIIVP
jgi:hypothetical protein